MYINSKHDLLEMELNGKGDLVCLATGQIKQLLESQDLLLKKRNNEEAL